jgi:hypothetical protein
LAVGQRTFLPTQAFMATGNKDDLEIDEFMKRAISQLSLDQRISPNTQNKTSPKSIDGEFPLGVHVSSPQAEDSKKRPQSNDENKPSSTYPSLSIQSTDSVEIEEEKGEKNIQENYIIRGKIRIFRNR